MQDYTTIAGVLHLHEQRLSQRDIAAKYRIGKGTVARTLDKAKKLGIDYNIIKDADLDDVVERFYSTRMSSSSKAASGFRKDLLMKELFVMITHGRKLLFKSLVIQDRK